MNERTVAAALPSIAVRVEIQDRLKEQAAMTTGDNQLVVSHLILRRCVGIIGLALPFGLALGLAIHPQGDGVQESISRYYHTPMRDLLVGALCAVGVFVAAHNGYRRKDRIAARITGLAAIGVALFPMSITDATTLEIVLDKLHLVSSAIFFLGLAYISLRVFPDPDPNSPPLPGKPARNRLYRSTGIVILVALAAMATYSVLRDPGNDPLESLRPLFWLESLGIVSFGTAWLVKGRTLQAVASVLKRRSSRG